MNIFTVIEIDPKITCAIIVIILLIISFIFHLIVVTDDFRKILKDAEFYNDMIKHDGFLKEAKYFHTYRKYQSDLKHKKSLITYGREYLKLLNMPEDSFEAIETKIIDDFNRESYSRLKKIYDLEDSDIPKVYNIILSKHGGSKYGNNVERFFRSREAIIDYLSKVSNKKLKRVEKKLHLKLNDVKNILEV